MDYVIAIRLYFEKHRLTKFLVNLFFILLTIIYLLPFWAGLVFSQETTYILAKVFHLDILLTGSKTLLFIYGYSEIFRLSKIRFLYLILYCLNVLLSIFSLLMGLETILDYLLIIANILGLFLLVGLYITSSNPKLKLDAEKTYKIDDFHIFLSIIIPLGLINILGRIYSSLV